MTLLTEGTKNRYINPINEKSLSYTDRIGRMQAKLNWPNLVSKNRAQKVTWKTRRANLETLGFRRYLGFSPKT